MPGTKGREKAGQAGLEAAKVRARVQWMKLEPQILADRVVCLLALSGKRPPPVYFGQSFVWPGRGGNGGLDSTSGSVNGAP